MSQEKTKLSRADRKQIEAAIAKAKNTDKRHKSAQDSIPFQRMFPDGICRVTDNYYSKTVQFQDINYQLNQNEDKTAIFDSWCDFLNYFDSSIHFQLSFVNLAANKDSYAQTIAIPPRADAFNQLRTEYTKMLQTQLARGNNGLVKTKFITFGVEADNLKTAKPRLERIEIDILNNFKRLGVQAEPLNGHDRLKLMHDVLHMDEQEPFRFSWDWLAPSGLSVKDFIAPSSFEFRTGSSFAVGKKYGRASFLQILAPELNDRMLADFLDIATWSKGKELPELKASLETINRTASGLITDIDRNYKALMKERGLDKEPESLAAEPVQEITVQEPEPVSAPDNGAVPDPAISVESMNAYGYTDSNMLPLTKERALELMERDVTVYMLHTDNTEAMAFDADEIRSFDGIFGVEVSEWETVKDRFAPQDYEKAFLDNPADSFAIYQLRDNDDTARLHYMNSEYLEKKGLSVQKENYAAVYAGNLDRRGDTQDKLNGLYETFNIRRPEDFRGHSLSVSDIVALKQNGVVSCHYVDSWGFKELPGFLKPENYLKNAEMAMEDDFGMIDGIINNGPRKTVAELEEQSKTGKPISLLELAQAVHREDEEKHRAQQPVRREKPGEKPSILAKLKAPSVADTKSVKSAPKRSAEREL